MPPVPYPPGFDGPVAIDPIDVDAIAKVSFDWTDWLTAIGGANIDAHSWTVSGGGAIADGVTPVDRKTFTVTPPAPSLVTPISTAHVYVDTAVVGDTITVSCHVRSGQVTDERSATMLVIEQ